MADTKDRLKNIRDLPESTSEEIREKLHCYMSERQHVLMNVRLLEARAAEIHRICEALIDKSAADILKKHRLSPVRLSFK